MTALRPANEIDLEAIYQVWLQTESPPENSGSDPRLASGAIPAYLRHVLQTGTLLVAEHDGVVVAYAGAITRAGITYLTDLFVDPIHQSDGLGKALLQTAMPEDGRTRCTLSSSDPRALAIYVRAGMIPQWPYFGLRLEQSRFAWKHVPPPDVEICETEPGDIPELVQADAECCGRRRPEEHAFWVQEERAVPVWFRRQGNRIGYGYIRLGGGTLWHPMACAVGPIGVSNAEDAASCVVAAVGWAAQRARVIRIGVPGSHSCLTPLLERGFRLTYVDTFMSTALIPYFDPRRYIPSGGDLL